jgi:hypothetical protein
MGSCATLRGLRRSFLCARYDPRLLWALFGQANACRGFLVTGHSLTPRPGHRSVLHLTDSEKMRVEGGRNESI